MQNRGQERLDLDCSGVQDAGRYVMAVPKLPTLRAKSLNELDCGNGSAIAELSLQVLSFLELVWIDAFRVTSQKTTV